VLGELLSFSNGINADKSAYGTGVPFANVLEVITNESIAETDIPGRIAIDPEVRRRYEVKPGDVLFNRTSETQEEVGLASVYVGNEPIVFGGFVLRGRPLTDELSTSYSKYAFRNPLVRNQIVARGQGGIRANIGQRDLKTVTIRLPSRREQSAIAKALDDVSELISTFERLITKKQAIKQGLMHQLLTGRTRLPGFSEPWDERASFEDLCTRSAGFWGAATASSNAPNQVQVITAGDITPEGRLKGAARRYFTSAQVAKARCLADDLVVTSSGNGLGKTAYIEDPGSLVASNFVRILRPRKGVSGAFLAQVMRTPEARALLDSNTATSAYPNLMPTFFTQRWIPRPRNREQLAIAAVLRDADTEIQALHVGGCKARAIKIGMMQQLLTGRTRLPVEAAA
jgi:type I restriction enzyme S subunit